MTDIQDYTNLYIILNSIDFQRFNSLCTMEFPKFNELLYL